ncbi:hypothetical protein NE865_12375 [Phthorimaea operculella]|nr:hypothetical protein NE865_12375 [Phthorimaea operculella]
MATDLGSNFHDQYMAINTKLKKRFMRKPNVSEATNEFIALAIQCENAEQPAFAGHCYVGAAKCEASVGNFLGEAEHFVAAARQFMKEEKKLKTLKLYSPDRENLEAAIGCYLQAIPKYPETSPLRTSILMELADHLIYLNHKKEALSYFEQALELVEDKFRRLMHTRDLLNLQIDCEQFDSALETANKICEEYQNIPENILSEVQISRILLALHVKPVAEDKPVSLTLPFNKDLHLKLQSVVLCCTTADIPSLISISTDLRQHLTIHQINLLDALLKEKRLEHLVLG